MGSSLRALALLAVGVAAALPAVDSSFLTQGMVPGSAPPSVTAPLFLTTAPIDTQTNGSATATAGAQKKLCPMMTLQPNSAIDPVFIRERPTGTHFDIRIQKPACKSK